MATDSTDSSVRARIRIRSTDAITATCSSPEYMRSMPVIEDYEGDGGRCIICIDGYTDSHAEVIPEDVPVYLTLVQHVYDSYPAITYDRDRSDAIYHARRLLRSLIVWEKVAL